MDAVELPSNRKFGFVFFVFFLLVAFLPVLKGNHPRYFFCFVSVGVLLISWWMPDRLTPLNRAWMRLGELMGRLTQPIFLGLVFYGIFSPIGMLMRFFGRDELCLKAKPRIDTYWKTKTSADARTLKESLSDQF